MSPSNTKPEAEIETLIGEFNRVRGELIEAVSSVPTELRDETFVGIWDVKDVVAHTVGWDNTNIDSLPDFREGRLPAFFAHYDSDWAAINAGLVASYRSDDWDVLMASLRESQSAFVDAMRSLTDADLDNVVLWEGRRISLRGMMRAVSRDESEHVMQVRQFLKERG
jgi:hypothetical protein